MRNLIFSAHGVLLTLSLLFSIELSANEFRGVLRNNKGVKAFQTEKPVEAFDHFSQSLTDLPFSPEVHFNLGTTFLSNKEFEKALSEYQEAIRRAPGNTENERKLRFLAYFNSAVALTAMKKIDEALEMYQHALNLYPQSIETKTNMELLIQQSQNESGEQDQEDQQNQNKDEKGEQKEDKKDGQGEDEEKEKKEDQPGQPPPKVSNEPKQKPTPRPFKSDQISQQDVNRILEELKRQEEQIRARMQQQGTKDAPPDKDW